MDFIKAVIKPSYWLTHQYPVPESWKLALTIFFGVLLALGIILFLVAKRKTLLTPIKTLLRKTAHFSLWMGISGYILLFFSIQRISFVSARVVYLLWFISALVWVYYIVRYAIKDMPDHINFQKEKESREKWLPKRK